MESRKRTGTETTDTELTFLNNEEEISLDPNLLDSNIRLLKTIENKDPELFQALISFMYHVQSTFSDKYEINTISLKDFKKSVEGKGFNIGNALKYLIRYNTKGFAKSESITDLDKAIHYILFEKIRLMSKRLPF